MIGLGLLLFFVGLAVALIGIPASAGQTIVGAALMVSGIVLATCGSIVSSLKRHSDEICNTIRTERRQ
jgi:hypothetical protein